MTELCKPVVGHKLTPAVPELHTLSTIPYI